MANSNSENKDLYEKFHLFVKLIPLALKGRKKSINYEDTVLPFAAMLFLRKYNCLYIIDTDEVNENEDQIIVHYRDTKANIDGCVCYDKAWVADLKDRVFRDLLVETLEFLSEKVKDASCIYIFTLEILSHEFKEGELHNLLDRAVKEVYHFKEESSQPHELSLLVSHFVDEELDYVLEPFGGFMDFATTMSDKLFIAYENNEQTFKFAKFRLALAETKYHVLLHHDTCENWDDGEYYDAIVTFPPFGIKLNMQDELSEGVPTDVDQAMLTRFEWKTLDHGQLVMVVPLSTLFRETSGMKDIRKSLTEKNFIDTIVVLPKNILRNTQVATAIIVLKKNRKKDDAIRLVDVSHCAYKEGPLNVINVENAIDIIDHPDGVQSIDVSREEIVEMNFSWHVGSYLFIHNHKNRQGCEIKSMLDVLEPAKSIDRFEEIYGCEVTTDALLCSAPYRYEFIPEDLVEDHGPAYVGGGYVRKIVEPVLLIALSGTSFPMYCKASEETPIFIKANNIVAYTVKDKTIHIGYLCMEFYHAMEELRKYFSPIMDKILLETIVEIPIPSYTEQVNLYEEAKKVAQEVKLRELGLQNIIDGYKKQIREKKHQIMQNTLALVSDWGDLKDYLYSNGGKFDEHDTVGTLNPIVITDLMNSLSENIAIIERKINHLTESDIDWGKKDEINIQNFIEDYIKNHQSTSFRFEFEKKKTILKQWFNKRGEVVLQNSEPDWHILIPHNALQQVFDNIVSNAKSHGFIKRDDSNYAIRFDYHYDFDKIILEISNNGEPLKEGVDTEYVKTYGKSTGTNTASIEKKSHEGLGGEEIDTILRKYDANFEVISTPSEFFTVTYRISFNNIINNELLLDEDYVFPDEIEN